MRATTLLALLLMAATAGAGEFDSRDSWWYRRSLVDDGMLERLKLNAEQKTHYDALAAEFAAKRDLWLSGNREKLRALEQTRDAARTAGDSQRADQLQAEYRDKLGELLKTREEFVQKFRSELSPAQQKDLDEALTTERKRQADTGTPRKTY